MSSFISYWKTLVWSLFMLLLFLLPADNLSRAPSIPHLDKAVHVFMFAVFSWFMVRDQLSVRKLHRAATRTYIKVILTGVIFGSAIEFLQEISNMGRSAEICDLVYDVTGCLVSVMIMLIFYRSVTDGPPKY